MTQPRLVVPKETYVVMRRCSERRFFLRPDAEVTKMMRFCIAAAALNYKMQVHAAVVMSNHYHLVITDTEGNMSSFMAWLNHVSALFLKVYRDRGRGETIWSDEKFSSILLVSREAVLRQLVYVITNPVRDGLVDGHRRWRGMVTRPDACLAPIKAPHPNRDIAVKEHKDMTLRITVPSCFRHMRKEEYVQMLKEAVKEEEIALRRARKGKAFLGMKKVLSKSAHSSPTKTQDKDTQAVITLNPRFAGVTKEAIAYGKKIIRGFRKAYRECMKRYQDGDRDILFPRGTYWMCRFHKMRLAETW